MKYPARDQPVCHIEDSIICVDMKPKYYKPPRRKPSRRVSFLETVVVQEVLHVKDMTEEEVYNSWYSNAEMDSVKKAILMEMHQMLAGNKMSDDFTFRGLESRVKDENKRRRAVKTNSIFAVLEEQDSQVVKERHNPQIIRAIYLEHSVRSQQEAENWGRSDALEARKVLLGDSLNSRHKCKIGHLKAITPAHAASPCSVVPFR